MIVVQIPQRLQRGMRAMWEKHQPRQCDEGQHADQAGCSADHRTARAARRSSGAAVLANGGVSFALTRPAMSRASSARGRGSCWVHGEDCIVRARVARH
eukprot:2185491-Prymnesium_polylepis.1